MFLIFQVTIYHRFKLLQTETDIMLGKKSLVVEFYDEFVSVYYMILVTVKAAPHECVIWTDQSYT